MRASYPRHSTCYANWLIMYSSESEAALNYTEFSMLRSQKDLRL